MGKVDLRFRQIHLDFHTSPDIEGIGNEFNAEEFASTLEKARVNSITCFARCHHGMMYYDSKAFPERVHPNLTDKNLVKEQIEACHQHGIRVPIYITVQWDHYTAQEHPEWLAVTGDGGISYAYEQSPYTAGFYANLCVNTPYREFLKAHTREVLEMLPTDGLFFDIVKPLDCSCTYCRIGMNAMGLDPARQENRMIYGQHVIDEFKRDMTNFVRRYNKGCSIFYNRGHIGTAHRPVVDAYTHFELESLPSGGWGYLHFPLTIRYARNLGLDCLAQTGKFHTSWGDFHSFKNKAALEFECYNMLALGAKCLIGDQLEPSGKLSKPVYEMIGQVYSEIEKKEPWCTDTKAVVEIGVFTPEEFFGSITAGRTSLPPAILGIIRMLQENAYQFDVIDSKSEFSNYKVLVLPDNIPVTGEFAGKLKKYIADGGKVIASFESGLDAEKKEFALCELGVRLKEGRTIAPDGKPASGRYFERHDFADYILPKGEIAKGLTETEHAMYIKGLEVEAEAGSEVMAETILPYFNRTYRSFCSHRQAPSSGEAGYAGIIKNNCCIYFAHPIFTQYNRNAPRWCKQLFTNALDILLPERILKHSGPSTVLTAINEQKTENRWILHMLHYIPERRSIDIDIIEDVIPIYNISLSIKVPKKVQEVICVPEGCKVDFSMEGNQVEFILPEVNGHQMVAIKFAP